MTSDLTKHNGYYDDKARHISQEEVVIQGEAKIHFLLMFKTKDR